MQILLVEDDEDKRRSIRMCLLDVVPSATISEARSMHGGLRALKEIAPQLVVLDMTMPSFDISSDEDGGRPQAYAGREILRHIKRMGKQIPTVVVTQFDRFGVGVDTRTLEQLDIELKTEFGGWFLGSVYYSVTYDDWRSQLAARLLIVVGAREES